MDFALGVFHDLHHALRHFLYEALGREERASKSGKLPAGPLHPSYWQRKEPLKPLGAAIWQSAKRLKTLRTFEPVIPLLGNHLEETGKKTPEKPSE